MLQLSSGAAVTCTVVTDKTGSTWTLLGQNIMCQSVNLAYNLNIRSKCPKAPKTQGAFKNVF